MKSVLVAALGAASIWASLSGSAVAQAPIVHLPDSAVARHGIDAQLSELGGRIDRYAAQGRLSPADADHARRELNRIQGAVTEGRERNGGHTALADRFELQNQIDKLREDLNRERTNAGATRQP